MAPALHEPWTEVKICSLEVPSKLAIHPPIAPPTKLEPVAYMDHAAIRAGYLASSMICSLQFPEADQGMGHKLSSFISTQQCMMQRVLFQHFASFPKAFRGARPFLLNKNQEIACF